MNILIRIWAGSNKIPFIINFSHFAYLQLPSEWFLVQISSFFLFYRFRFLEILKTFISSFFSVFKLCQKPFSLFIECIPWLCGKFSFIFLKDCYGSWYLSMGSESESSKRMLLSRSSFKFDRFAYSWWYLWCHILVSIFSLFCYFCPVEDFLFDYGVSFFIKGLLEVEKWFLFDTSDLEELFIFSEMNGC